MAFQSASFATDVTGSVAFATLIPLVPSLAGVEIALQMVVLDPLSSSGFVLTDGIAERFGFWAP